MKPLSIALVLLVATGASASAETRLIRENSRREYLVIYDAGASDLLLNPYTSHTRYPILYRPSEICSG